jgi:hypothetical protein
MAGPAPVNPQAALIAAVTTAMGALVHPASTNMAVAAHPYTAHQRWDYTRTWQVVVAHGGANHNVRGHVHYQRTRVAGGAFAAPAAYTAGPGRYWISGVNGWDAATPAWMVTARNTTSALERTNATNAYNNTHPHPGTAGLALV